MKTAIAAQSFLAVAQRSACCKAALLPALAMAMALGVAAEPVQVPDSVEVSASRLPQAPAGLAQSVKVLDRAAIEASGATTLAQLLSREANILVDNAPASGRFGSLYLRGADPSYTAIVLDGVTLNDPTGTRGAAVNLSLLDLANIERIEIVSGNASAVTGGALAGAIHLSTRRVGGGPGTARLGVGGGGYSLTQARLPGQAGPLDFDVYASRSEEGREPQAGDSGDSGSGGRTRQTEAGLRLGSGPAASASSRYRAQLRYTESESQGFPDDSGGPLYAQRRSLEAQSQRSVLAALTAEWRDLPWGGLELDANSLTQNGSDRSPGVAPGLRDPAGLPRSDIATHFERHTLRALARPDLGNLGEGRQAVLGLESLLERGSADGALYYGPVRLPSSFKLQRRTTALLAEAGQSLAPVLSGASLQAGLRLESSAGYATQVQPHLGLLWQADAANELRLNAGRGRKLPSFFALAHPLVGNPDLRPEVATTLEAAWDHRYGAIGAPHVRLAWFQSDFRDLVDFSAGPPPRLINRGKIRTQGLELGGEARLSATLGLEAQGYVANTRPEDGKGPLRARADRHASVTGTWAAGGWDVRGVWNLVGTRFDSSIPTGDRDLAGYGTLDLGVQKALGAHRLALWLDNALDRRYDEVVGSPNPGRRWRGEWRWQF